MTIQERYEGAKRILDERRSRELGFPKDMADAIRRLDGETTKVHWWQPGTPTSARTGLPDAVEWDVSDARCAVDVMIAPAGVNVPICFLRVPIRLVLVNDGVGAYVGTDERSHARPEDAAMRVLAIVGEMVERHVLDQAPKPLPL